MHNQTCDCDSCEPTFNPVLKRAKEIANSETRRKERNKRKAKRRQQKGK